MSYSPSYIKTRWESCSHRRISRLNDLQHSTPRRHPYSKQFDEIGGYNTSSSQIFDDTDLEKIIESTNIIEQPWRDEDKVVEFMKNRYFSKEFCTWAGQTLLVTHPYGEQDISENPNSTKKPAINALVNRVWFMLSRRLGKPDHCIVITGESGAGKTYSACLAIKYIARKEMSPAEDDILWKVWSSVPLLTAFGNASTAHNYNSSRFGKLLQLQFDNGEIKGAFLKTFMLEKSRITGPNDNDGNYHIFRQILENLDEVTLRNLHLNRQIEYKIVPRVKLSSSYTDTVRSLEILNITELNEILTLLALILNLGNVTFEQIEEVYDVSYDSLEFVENAALLLGIPARDLIDILCSVQFCHKSGNKRDSIYKSACMNEEECEERRNSLMKFLYNSLFNWLVKSINAKICCNGNFNHLGLLDVYGFEVFDHNTFEQLCINYANERLQQHFMVNYLQNMRDELVCDGFSMESIDISDYSTRIALIDGPLSSIFGILNEECAVKRFNNDFFVNARLTESLKGREHFIAHLNNLKTTFSISHYAGVVEYDTRTMLQKNRDKIPEDIINFIKICKFDFLKALIVDPVDNGKTLTTNFKKSLDELMHSLANSEVHYIKCLKPNPYRITEFFDETFYKQQLQINGIFEMLKINFKTFPIKLNYDKFIRKYSARLYHCLKKFLDEKMFIGRRNIYLTMSAYDMFEKLNYIQASSSARKIQLAWLKYANRRNKAAIILQRFCRKHVLKDDVICYDKIVNLSKKSSEHSMNMERLKKTVNFKVGTNIKIEEYLRKHRFDVHFEGDQLSLMLESVYNNIKTKPFKRVLFCGDRIVSFNRLAEIPVRFHTSKTCLRYSHLLPKSELPQGLLDII